MDRGGQVTWARFYEGRSPFFFERKRSTLAQRHGILYEHGIQLWLLKEWANTYLPSPWLRYCRKGEGPRWAQPDGLSVNPWTGEVVIVEVKYQHTYRAWEQLREIYGPVVRALFPSPDWQEPYVLEICRWHDPCITLPEPVRISAGLADIKAGAYNLLIREP